MYNTKNILCKKWNYWLLFFYVIVCPAIAHTQIHTSNPAKNKIDSIVHRYAASYLADTIKAGVSIGVYYKGETYGYHYGTVEKGKTILPSDQTLYEIASLTKTFTGLLLAKAIEENKMNLQDDIRKHLPGEYPNLEFKDKFISLREIALHQSGLPRDIPYDAKLWEKPYFNVLPYQLINLEKNYNKAKYLEALHAIKLDTMPGSSGFNYSNFAVKVLSFALENVYGMSYEILLEKYIFKPTGIKNSAIVLSESQKKLRAKGYNHNGKQMPNGLDNAGAAGGLKSTLPDMLKYLGYNMNRKDKIISIAHRPISIWTDAGNTDAAALFWQMRKKSNGGWRIFQSGGTFGFSSTIVLFPDADIGFVLLANDAGFNSQSQLGEIADNIYTAIK
ncbi:MAG: serine hydrolase domain-containing protein [Ferruginibacter sp.]